MFHDPAGQFRFELPLDWAYDPERSDLRMLVFARGEPETETLVVTVVPTHASPDASTEEWISAVIAAPRRYPAVASTQVRCEGGVGVTAEGGGDEASTGFFRELTIRGPRLDFTAEHRVLVPPLGLRASDTLPVLCRTAGVPVNEVMPRDPGEVEIAADLRRAREASLRQARAEVVEAAERVRQGALGAYLHSNAVGQRWPEIGAVLYLVDALTLLGATELAPTASLVLLRDAERLTLRAKVSMQAMPFPDPDRRNWLLRGLDDRLKIIADLHATATAPGDQGSFPPAGYGLTHRRVAALLSRMQLAVQAGHLIDAQVASETAIADLFTLLHMLRGITREITQEQEGEPGVDAAERSALASRAEAARLAIREQEMGLAAVLGFLSFVDLHRGDVDRATEASGLLVRVARAIAAKPDPTAGETDRALFLAFPLLDHARNLIWLGDAPQLEEAQPLLLEAAQLLDRIGEGGVYRAQLSIVCADLAFKRGDFEGVRAAAARGLTAGANDPAAASTTAALQRLVTLLEVDDASDLDKARGVLLALLALPESGVRERLLHASYYLDLASVEQAAGDIRMAREHVLEALRRILSHAPHGEESIRAFQMVAQLSRGNEFPLAYQSRVAAVLAFEARRAGFRSEQVRLSLGEVQGNRAIYEDFVEWLIGLLPLAEAPQDVGPNAVDGDFPSLLRNEALAIADRERTHLLNEALAVPTGTPLVSTQPDPVPNLDSSDSTQALLAASDYVIRGADAELTRRGAVLPLQGNEVQDLAKDLAVPVLLVQPCNQAVRLMALLPTGEVETALSPLPFADLRKRGEELQSLLRIFSVPRGELESSSRARAEQDVDKLAVELWQALIGPLAAVLPVSGPLIVAPFGPVALLPFALLQGPEGRRVVDRYDLSVTPSLGVLRQLRRRGTWSRPWPRRAYVAGDPALAKKFGALKPLPAARNEAETLAALLRRVGLEEDRLHLRLGPDAHEESYRHEARGCDLVHVAGHAQLWEPAYTSRLYLAPHGKEDGLLLAEEVAEVTLDDALVFLSACETGQGRPTAEGVVGLGYSFLRAGARAVVLSLWKVEDNATSALAGHFYRSLLDDGRGPSAAAALREAMTATRTDLAAGRIAGPDGQPLDSRPAHWAPFLILGDAEAIRYGVGLHERERALGDR